MMPTTTFWLTDEQKATLKAAAKKSDLKYQTFTKMAALRAAKAILNRDSTLIDGRVFEVIRDDENGK